MTGSRTKLARLTVAVLFAVPTLLGAFPTSSSAAPTKTQVRQAKAKLDQLNRQLEVAVEQFNTAKVRLGIAEQKLQAARTAMQTAQAQADAARAELSQRAVEAYTGAGSQLDVLLGAQSFSDFSDQLEFMGALAQSDADLATKAEVAGQQAKYAAQQYQAAVGERQNELDQMQKNKSDIENLVGQAAREYRRITHSYAKYQAFLRQQAAATQHGSGGSSGGGNGGGYVPPPNATEAEIAIGAAKAALGTAYVWGSADPNVGFDCSGLTSWAWSKAGVYLPHSSEMQYAVLPHVPLDQIEPGDLLFFYTPISHVAMYIGGGMMIHARHPGPGGEVQINPMDQMWMQDYVGAARPG